MIYNTTDLPAYIQAAIEYVYDKHPEYKTPRGARGNCVMATDFLLFKCDELLGEELCDGRMVAVDDFYEKGPHAWADIEGWQIDLTARQFNPNEPCPKIWKLHTMNTFEIPVGDEQIPENSFNPMKDNEAFKPMAGCAYVPEEGDRMYTYEDYIEIAKGNERLARILFDLSDWQHPETILLELFEEGEVIEDGKTYKIVEQP
jgi:hypothetical protein